MDEAARIRTEKLRWASRRALLENDLVLQRFWQSQALPLDAALAARLERLLTLDDHELWALLSGRQQCADADLQALVTQLVRHAEQ